MRNYDYLAELLADAYAFGNRILKVIERAQFRLGMTEPCCNTADYEEIFRLAAIILCCAQNMLPEAYDTPPEPEELFDAEHTLCVDANWESAHILRCTMPPLPLTKKRASAGSYTALYSEKLVRKLQEEAPAGFRQYRQAYVIYAHYDRANAGCRVPYYDNDNLAIKALLDSVVPLVCVDDAAPICNNLYFYVPSEQRKTELWVVERGYLSHWAEAHPEMPILEDLRDYYWKEGGVI